ncbi:hypothetical protein H6G89_14365 [Oscillatoria sp. FACHB-1407]|uniref:hypothetical protein n=1 Tax=Oscillatoria sp. FACHB-1407 TaxID=2692847 RepID=UPI001687F34C|nr:hypothetical protein [Oscillatoria sp. FACHB-1407]MBD2462228.1 hypothetical protein [Oscillatoria sp. FACHB-1407]
MRSLKVFSSLPKSLKYAALVWLIPGLLFLSTALPLAATFPTSQDLGKQSAQQMLVQATPDGAPPTTERVRPLDVWQQVYERLPDLPREDQYISSETGQIATSSTLISRLIRYHTFVRGRSPNYRFDWKLTLADYLGVNELIRSAGYPGYDTLTVNPLSGDREAIGQLTRAQRDTLVNVLVSVFTTANNTASPTPTTPSRPTATPRPSVTPPVIQPRPGDAQLLQL